MCFHCHSTAFVAKTLPFACAFTVQAADDSSNGLRQLEQAVRAESDARLKLETTSTRVSALAADLETRAAQQQQEVLAIEESLETGLTHLRGELIGRLEGSMAASEEGDRRREQDLRHMQGELSMQIDSLKQRKPVRKTRDPP